MKYLKCGIAVGSWTIYFGSLFVPENREWEILQLWPVTSLVGQYLRQLSEADKPLVWKWRHLNTAPFESITISWHSGLQIPMQSPTHGATRAKQFFCLLRKLSPPPGFLILYFIACFRLSASYLIPPSDLMFPSFSAHSIFLIWSLFTLVLIFHVLPCQLPASTLLPLIAWP